MDPDLIIHKSRIWFCNPGTMKDKPTYRLFVKVPCLHYLRQRRVSSLCFFSGSKVDSTQGEYVIRRVGGTPG